MANGEHITEYMQCEARILEIVGDNPSIDVPVNPSIDIGVITANDPDPKFANVEVIRSGILSGNRRHYSSPIISEINDMIPGVQGFLGHPDPSKYGFEFREPQCIYVGSMLDNLPDGTVRSIAKAYLFKASPLREWVPASIAANNPMTVSINGTADVINNGDYVDVIHMSSLDSIDWANPGTEGIGTSQAVSIVNEMQNNLGGNGMAEQVDVKNIISNATVTEFKAFNPNGFKGVIGSITVQELQQENPELFNKVKESGKITEMKLTVGGQEQSVKLTEMQGIINANEAKITELNATIEKQKLTEFKNAEIAKLVPEAMREGISKRVTGSTEKEISDSIASEIAYVREMGGNFDNMPINTQGNHGADSIMEQVKNLFGTADKK
jgi:hypothetical protein